jgi:hypothetical protein
LGRQNVLTAEQLSISEEELYLIDFVSMTFSKDQKFKKYQFLGAFASLSS